MGFFGRSSNDERDHVKDRDRELDRQSGNERRNFRRQERNDNDKLRRDNRDANRKISSNARRERELEKRDERSREKAEKLERQRKSKHGGSDRNIERVKGRGFIERFQRRNEPESRRARIDEKKLIAEEKVQDAKIQKAKHDKKKFSLQSVMRDSKKSRSSTGRKSQRKRSFDNSDPVARGVSSFNRQRESVTSSGLSDMFGSGNSNAGSFLGSSSPSVKKKKSGDGLNKMFGV